MSVIPPGSAHMNAPERVRAYLTARAESPEQGYYIAVQGDAAITEADLEACLQTIEILARIHANNQHCSTETVLRVAEYIRNIKEVPEHENH